MFNHNTVMLKEAVNGLNVKKGGIYVDATLGGGGHSQFILDKLEGEGILIVFDQDEVAIKNAKKKFSSYNNIIIIKDNFSKIIEYLNHLKIERIDGILFDLGLSSMQIDESDRGFSYMKEGPLDMRMNQESDFSAYNVINEYSVEDLTNVFEKFGEEKFSRLIAKRICEKRENKKFVTTKDLNELILNSIPKKFYYNAKSHPSKRVFQATRIEVNKELDVFENTLIRIKNRLSLGGRISVISFHSLEDRICKFYFKKWSSIKIELKNLPVIPEEYLPEFKMINNKPILPIKEELEENSRSKSAKLRILEKVK